MRLEDFAIERDLAVMHVDRAPVAKAHLVLGGVHVNIDQRGIEFKKEHERRVTAMVKDIPVRLLDGVGNQAVANHAAIDEKILQVSLAA